MVNQKGSKVGNSIHGNSNHHGKTTSSSIHGSSHNGRTTTNSIHGSSHHGNGGSIKINLASSKNRSLLGPPGAMLGGLGSSSHDSDESPEQQKQQQPHPPPYGNDGGQSNNAYTGSSSNNNNNKSSFLSIHQICLIAPTAQDLCSSRALVSAPSAALTDAHGRLPLHCVSYNKQLADALAFDNGNSNTTNNVNNGAAATAGAVKMAHLDEKVSSVEEQLTSFVVDTLLDAYPAAMISPDTSGKIPFEGFLREWVMSSLMGEQTDDGVNGGDGNGLYPNHKTKRRSGLLRSMSMFQGTNPKNNNMSTAATPVPTAYGFDPGTSSPCGYAPPGGFGLTPKSGRELKAPIPMTPLVGTKPSVGHAMSGAPPMTPLVGVHGDDNDKNGDSIRDISMTPLQLGIENASPMGGNLNDSNATMFMDEEKLFSYSPKKGKKDSAGGGGHRGSGGNNDDHHNANNGLHDDDEYYATNNNAATFSEWDLIFPKDPIRLTAQAYYAFKMLSAIVDYFDRHVQSRHAARRNSLVHRPDGGTFLASNPKGKRGGAAGNTDNLKDQLRNFTESDICTEIVQSIARIPQIIKVVLLMDDADQRQYVLSCSIIRRVLCNKLSVGGWLPAMFQSSDNESNVSDRAILYLDVADEACRKSSAFDKKRGDEKMSAQDEYKRFEIYDDISRLQDFVPSLLSLRERQVEEASTTRLVIGVLDRIIARPFCMSVVVIDVVFMALTIASYRASVDHLLLGYPSKTILRYIYLANIGIFYFLIRELGKCISLCMITNRPGIYFLSFWNLIDLWSTLLLLVSVVTMRIHLATSAQETTSAMLRNLMAIATGFFWLRVLNFLKGINMQLATFVLAIIHITRDVVWFAVILLALVVSFAQMFFTLLAPGYCANANDPNFNSTDYDIKDYPECVQAEYYLKIYSIFIFQEFDREEFTTFFSVLLIVLYSFMVVLVLLNVLIAVASDSYEKCLVRGQNLFGRARVMMVAELVSFQNLLRRNSTASGVYKGWWSRSSSIAGWSRGSVVFFSLCLLVIVIWMIAETVVYLLGPGDVNVFMSMGSVFVNVALFVGMMIFLTSGAGDIVARLNVTNATAAENNRLQSFSSGSMNFLYKAVLRMLGSSGHDRASGAQSNDVWGGRLRYLEDRMIQVSEETKKDNKERVKALETSLRNDLSRIERAIEAMRNESPGVVISGMPLDPGLAGTGGSTGSGGKTVDKTLTRILDVLHAIRAKVDDKPGQN